MERIDGTILIEQGWRDRMGKTPYGATVQVDWAGEIEYAVIGERGQRIWWFAGVGSVEESGR